jgi:hypothetical protein
MNPADQAQIEQAKFNASQARKDAGNLITSATQNAQMFTNQAEQKLAQGMTILGKTGNLSGDTSAPMESGVPLGANNNADWLKQKADLEASIPDLTSRVNDPHALQPEHDKAVQNLQNAKDSLTALGAGGSALQDIRNPDALLHASGSDLLTMVTTRDAMERDKRTLMRNAQSEAVKALQAGENYDKMGEYAPQAASCNTWSTILGGGLKIAGMAAGFGWNPFK